MITSTRNTTVKHVRRLQVERRYRQRERAFVVEGSRWLKELSEMQLQPHFIMVTEPWVQGRGNQALLEQCQAKTKIVSGQIMAYISDTESYPGVLAVVRMLDLPLPARPELLLILDQVRNPGNMGSVLRTAAAAGVEGVLLAPGCVDVYNPKVVRGGMGAHLRLPLVGANWNEINDHTIDLALSLAVASGGKEYWQRNWCKPSALVVGSEASGVSREAKSLDGERVSIPMQHLTESLNVAVAAGIILFEAARQRRESKRGQPTSF